MGTDDGLARYDGYQFRVFRHEPGDSLSLNNNVIRAIISDPSGQLWIGTEGGGVSIFDPIREKFSPIYLNENFPIILKDGKVSSMLLANDQSIWISTNGGGVISIKIDFESSSDWKVKSEGIKIRHFHNKNSNLKDNKV
ncbi:MAG TPA: hypothetical protein DHU93_03865, partial [Algoriphagus sp.]|nr:hypothetical protein [Algoriphagus sp.]